MSKFSLNTLKSIGKRARIGRWPPVAPEPAKDPEPTDSEATLASLTPEVGAGSAPVSCYLQLDQMTPSPLNPRKKFDMIDLAVVAENIKKMGILEPIIVRGIDINPDSMDPRDGQYPIMAGERRYRAAKLLQKNGEWPPATIPGGAIPCVVVETDDTGHVLRALVENLLREDLTALEECDAFAALELSGMKPSAIAGEIGKSARYVQQRLQLRQLTHSANALLVADKIPFAVARLLVKEDDEAQDDIGERIKSGEIPATEIDVANAINTLANRAGVSQRADDDGAEPHEADAEQAALDLADDPAPGQTDDAAVDTVTDDDLDAAPELHPAATPPALLDDWEALLKRYRADCEQAKFNALEAAGKRLADEFPENAKKSERSKDRKKNLAVLVEEERAARQPVLDKLRRKLERARKRAEDATSGDGVVYMIEGRPVRVHGTDATAVEFGYFPISETGYRSFLTLSAFPPTREDLEDCVRDLAKELKSLKREARKVLNAEPGADNAAKFGQLIHFSGTVERLVSVSFLAPADEQQDLLHHAAAISALTSGFKIKAKKSETGAWTKPNIDAKIERLKSIAAACALAQAGDWGALAGLAQLCPSVVKEFVASAPEPSADAGDAAAADGSYEMTKRAIALLTRIVQHGVTRNVSLNGKIRMGDGTLAPNKDHVDELIDAGLLAFEPHEKTPGVERGQLTDAGYAAIGTEPPTVDEAPEVEPEPPVTTMPVIGTDLRLVFQMRDPDQSMPVEIKLEDPATGDAAEYVRADLVATRVETDAAGPTDAAGADPSEARDQ